jgi:hypothetical protein
LGVETDEGNFREFNIDYLDKSCDESFNIIC